MLKIKLAVVAFFLSLAGFALINSQQFTTSAKTDFIQEITSYKTWSKITKEPLKFNIDEASGGGWSFIIDGVDLLSREERKKDVVGIFSDIGKGLKRVFRPAKKTVANNTTHGTFTFGVVYANDLAKAEIEKENPIFPVGSIIVREKNASAMSQLPESVIAMVKREKDFSKKTNDWEFLSFNGTDLKMQKRETKGDCATCHIRAEKNDWVFRDYLK